MMDPRKTPFAYYARRIADLMALRDWTITIEHAPVEDAESNAEVRCVYGKKHAVIRLSEGFLESDPASQRHSVVHELLHCHFDHAAMIALDAMPDDVRPAYRRMFEVGIDGAAEALAGHLPLPQGDGGVVKGMKRTKRATRGKGRHEDGPPARRRTGK